MTRTAEKLMSTGDADGEALRLRERFKSLAHQLENFAASRGVKIRPYTSPAVPHFSVLPTMQKQAIVEHLEHQLQIYLSTKQQDGLSFSQKNLIWMALQHFHLRPPSDFIDNIREDNVVLIYNTEGRQLFANLRFFDLCSYTLEQVMCQHWTELWERDPASIQLLESKYAQIMQENCMSTIHVTGSQHIIKEKNSPLALELNYQLKAIAPLWDRATKAKEAFVVIEGGEILSQLPDTLIGEDNHLAQVVPLI